MIIASFVAKSFIKISGILSHSFSKKIQSKLKVNSAKDSGGILNIVA